MTNHAISVQGLSKSFGDKSVLSNVSLTVSSGKTLAIVGRSGSGKSTLLKCLNLLVKPDAGKLSLYEQVYLEDREVLYAEWEIRRQIGLVLQSYPLFPNMTVLDNLKLALSENLALSVRGIQDEISVVAGHLGIVELFNRYPKTLSGGQAQRCALARALVLKPRVLLLDEITSALDMETINDVVGAIGSLRSASDQDSLSIILVTHLLRFAESFADEIAFLDGGRILESHNAKSFMTVVSSESARAFVEAYRADSQLI